MSEVFAGLSIAAAAAAIIGAGALMAAPGFARWLTNKVATFFGGGEDEEHDEAGPSTCSACDGAIDDDDGYMACDEDTNTCMSCIEGNR